MSSTRVTDPADPRVRDYVSLRDVTLRRSLEAESGLFIAEGEKVIRRAEGAGYSPRSFFMSPRWLGSLRDVVERHPQVPCYVADESVVEQVSGFHVHRGALAAFHRTALRSTDEILASSRRVLVLEDVNDHSNVGAIFRNAAAFGFDGVLLSPRCADPLYRRAIKVSMGTVFSVRYARVEDWYGLPDLLRNAGFEILALTPGVDAVDLDEVGRGGQGSTGPPDRVAVLLGSEGHGLSERWLTASDRTVRIPIEPGIDSLNVAATSAIACYVLGLSRAGQAASR